MSQAISVINRKQSSIIANLRPVMTALGKFPSRIIPSLTRRSYQHLPKPDRALNLTELIAPITNDMKAVDAVIRQRLDSDVVLIRTIGDYIVGAGGKRMRPAM